MLSVDVVLYQTKLSSEIGLPKDEIVITLLQNVDCDSFLSYFFCSYHKMISTESLFDSISKFDYPNPEKIKSLLIKWITKHNDDFRFINQDLLDQNLSCQKDLLDLIKTLHPTPRHFYESDLIFPTPASLFQEDVTHLAEQLTFFHESQFNQISRTSVFLYKSPEKGEQRKDPLDLFILHFNFISGWVQQAIIQTTELPKRIQVAEKALQLCAALLALRNFHGFFAVFSAFEASSVYRLTKTFHDIRRTSLFATIAHVTNTKENCKNYRSLLFGRREGETASTSTSAESPNPMRRATSSGQQIKPSIPYLGRLLTDLVHFSDGMPSKKGDNFNILKFITMGKTIYDCFSLKFEKFDIKPDAKFQNFFDGLDGFVDEEKLYAASLVLEPRETKSIPIEISDDEDKMSNGSLTQRLSGALTRRKSVSSPFNAKRVKDTSPSPSRSSGTLNSERGRLLEAERASLAEEPIFEKRSSSSREAGGLARPPSRDKNLSMAGSGGSNPSQPVVAAWGTRLDSLLATVGQHEGRLTKLDTSINSLDKEIQELMFCIQTKAFL